MTDTSLDHREIAALRQRLAEAEETLNAITGGEVDALVVQTKAGEQVFTLQGADAIYRTAIENINEGILSLSPEGAIFYANNYFARMVGTDLNKVIGNSIYDFVSSECRTLLIDILNSESGRDEITLKTSTGRKVPVYFTVNRLHIEKSAGISAVVTDLTQQKRSEEVIAAGRLINAVNSIFREYMTTVSREQLGAFCLAVAQELTQSKIGFIDEMGPDVLLHEIAMSSNVKEHRTVKDKEGHRGLPGIFPSNGLYGAVLDSGRSVLTNNPQDHPFSNGLPAGHPPLENFLGVPLLHQGKTIGILALANREGGYSSNELHTAEALAPAITEVMMRKKAEEEVISYREHLEQLVAERTRELRELAHRLVDAQEKERSDIGSALHDEIGQYLTYTILLIDKAIRKPDPALLTEAKSTVQETITRIRDLSSMLSPKLLRSAGLAQALASLIEDYSRRTKIKVTFNCADGVDSITEEIALACYRIVQESLTNILRHAKATEVEVNLIENKEELCLEVTDNGIGFNPGKMLRATGLTGMRERAVALGGEFSIQSGPGQGTKIFAVIPLSERKQS